MRAVQVTGSLARLTSLRRGGASFARLQTVKTLSTAAAPSFKPEDIITECFTIRESIQALNDEKDQSAAASASATDKDKAKEKEKESEEDEKEEEMSLARLLQFSGARHTHHTSDNASTLLAERASLFLEAVRVLANIETHSLPKLATLLGIVQAAPLKRSANVTHEPKFCFPQSVQRKILEEAIAALLVLPSPQNMVLPLKSTKSGEATSPFSRKDPAGLLYSARLLQALSEPLTDSNGLYFTSYALKQVENSGARDWVLPHTHALRRVDSSQKFRWLLPAARLFVSLRALVAESETAPNKLEQDVSSVDSKKKGMQVDASTREAALQCAREWLDVESESLSKHLQYMANEMQKKEKEWRSLSKEDRQKLLSAAHTQTNTQTHTDTHTAAETDTHAAHALIQTRTNPVPQIATQAPAQKKAQTHTQAHVQAHKKNPTPQPLTQQHTARSHNIITPVMFATAAQALLYAQAQKRAQTHTPREEDVRLLALHNTHTQQLHTYWQSLANTPVHHQTTKYMLKPSDEGSTNTNTTTVVAPSHIVELFENKYKEVFRQFLVRAAPHVQNTLTQSLTQSIACVCVLSVQVEAKLLCDFLVCRERVLGRVCERVETLRMMLGVHTQTQKGRDTFFIHTDPNLDTPRTSSTHNSSTQLPHTAWQTSLSLSTRQQVVSLLQPLLLALSTRLHITDTPTLLRKQQLYELAVLCRAESESAYLSVLETERENEREASLVALLAALLGDFHLFVVRALCDEREGAALRERLLAESRRSV